MSKEAFDDWGWRVPFLVSILMVFVSYIIRNNMSESPLFAKAKAEGKTSANPLKESFGNKYNFKFVLLALFGATMGQGVVWYTGQFYAMNFIKTVCNVDAIQSDELMTIALLMGTPFFVVFGWLSDKIGRKGIMMVGMLVAILSYRPIYERMYQTTNLKTKQEVATAITTDSVMTADPKVAGGADQDENRQEGYTDGTKLTEVTKTKMARGRLLPNRLSRTIKKQ